MRFSFLKKPKAYILLGIAAAIILTSIVFHPAFQKKILLDHVGPLVDSLQIEHIHLTPWSLKLKRAAVNYEGGHFQLEDGVIKFCLWSLLTKTIDLKTILLNNFAIDLKDFKPPPSQETGSGPFPGALALLNHGFSLSLQELLLNGNVTLSDQQSVVVKLQGEGIKPNARGGIHVAIRLNQGDQGDHYDVNGNIAIKQLARGKFHAIETNLNLKAVLAALPAPESVDLNAIVSGTKPAVDIQKPAQLQPEDEAPKYDPEALHVAVSLNDNQGKNRSLFELNGVYNGNFGAFAGNYRITANERLVQPYVKKRPLPSLAELASGDINFNIATLTGNMTIKNNLRVTDLGKIDPSKQLPEKLELKNDLRVSLLSDNKVKVEAFDTGIFDETENKTLVSRLPSELMIPLDNPKAFLQQKNILLELELPGIPMAWFNAVLPDHEITSGVLHGAFKVSTDGSSAIHLQFTKELGVSGLAIKQQDQILVKDVNISALPTVTYTEKDLKVSVDKVRLDAQKVPLATASFNAVLSLGEENQGAISAKANGRIQLSNILVLPVIKQHVRQELPKDLSLSYDSAVTKRGDVVEVNELNASVSQGNYAQFLQIHLLQPLAMQVTESGQRLKNPTGELAKIAINNFNLGWLTAFVPDLTLKGAITRAEFSLATAGEDAITLSARSPLQIKELSLEGKKGILLEGLQISLKPEISYSSKGSQVSYTQLSVASSTNTLISAQGNVTVPGAESKQKKILADGRVDIDVQALAKQPVIAKALAAPIVSPVHLEADYRLAQDDASMDIGRLAVNVYYSDRVPRIAVKTDSGLKVLTRVSPEEKVAPHAVGRVTVDLIRLSPEPFAKVLEAKGISFSEAYGRATVTSDGTTLTLDTIEPFIVKDIGVKSEGRDLLDPLTLKARTKTTVQGQRVRAQMEEVSIAFGKDKKALTMNANIDLTMKDTGEVKVEALSTDLMVSLPEMLDQPVILPGHRLIRGELKSKISLDPSGRIRSSTRIENLQGKEDLALHSIDIPVAGQLYPNGGFSFNMPIKGKGKSGYSDVLVTINYMPKEGGNKLLLIDVTSNLVYLNDLLSTLTTIEDEKKEETKEKDNWKGRGHEQLIPSKHADQRAFWDITDYDDYDAKITLNLDRLFYTDYLEVHDIRGGFVLSPARISLTDGRAYFHQSPLSLDGAMGFNAGEKSPYDLKLKAGVKRFNLAQFLRELVPGSTPRAEGLFNVNLVASGKSPNLPQYRNHLLFDMRLQSRDGVFRPLSPDSVLIAGSSNFAGAVGEGMSYVPTGFFGLGAVSRLVNYIKEIKYDRIDIHVVRDESKDLKIKEYVIQSPDILLIAQGGIRYQEGKDILHSPLSLTAQLDMRAQGAAILHSLDLLKSEKDQYGYWTGPEIKVWGTPIKSQSNFEEIITRAGEGTVLGGVTRPLSGLLGNIKYRWLDEGKPIEYKKE